MTTGLQIIGAGMGRTGTSSLKRALEQLGFGPCHHMEEVFKHPAEVPVWERAARGAKVDWKTLLSPYRSACDFPSAFYYRELMETFPDAKVILSVRDASSWYDSVRETILPAMMRFPNPIVLPWLPFFGAATRSMKGTMFHLQIAKHFSDRARVEKVFEDWNAEVKRVVPRERLLVHQAKDGWGPLCAFLGVPVPETPYPRVNDTASFKKRVVLSNAIAWVFLLLPVAVVLLLVSWAI